MPHQGRAGSTVRTSIAAASTAALAVAAGAAVLAGTVFTSAPAAARAVTAASSFRPAAVSVAGRVGADIVVTNTSASVVDLVDPRTRRVVSVLARNATASAVVGRLVEYRQGGVLRWMQVGTGRGAVVPSTWAAPAPDGGLRVVRSGTRAVLEYHHVDGHVQQAPLPSSMTASGVSYDVLAGATEVLVVANSANARPVAVAAPLSSLGPFTTVRTTRLLSGLTLDCTSMSTRAAGCLTQRGVVRLTLDGGTDPQEIDTVASAVAVTDGATAWTAPDRGTRCPCELLTVDTTGTAYAVLAGLTAPAVRSGAGVFLFSMGTTRPAAGVYSAAFASATRRQVFAAPGAPLRAGPPALGTGAVAWADDSAAGGPLSWARVGGAGRHVAVRAAVTRPAVSGLRTAFTGTDGVLRVAREGGPTVTVGRGSLLGLSGGRLLLRGPKGHLVLVDLVHGGRTDLTAAYGARSAALWGNDVSYLRADGSVWRTDVVAHRTQRVATAPAGTSGAGGRAGRVYAWGNWTAWVVSGQPARVRNMLTLSAIRTLPADAQLWGAGAAGPIVRQGGSFALLGWFTGRRLAALPANTGPTVASAADAVPSVDGAQVAWLNSGTPSVATIGADVVNRPRSLGDLAAATGFRYGATWTLELPTSAPLNRCVVTITRGAFRAVRPCALFARSVGTIDVSWRGRTASGRPLPAGAYRWRVTAGGADGALLTAGGPAGPIGGTVVLTR